MAGYLPLNPFGGGGIEGLDQIPENHVVVKADGENSVKDYGIVVSDTEFDIGPQRALKAGVASFQLGEAHSISSGGENVFTKNLIDDDILHPPWQMWDGDAAMFRRRLQPMQEVTQESSKDDVLTNPRWRSDPIVDWTVVQLTFEASEPETNVYFTVERDGIPFWSVRLPDMPANVETTIDLTVDKNTPVDAFQAGEYFVSVRSDDGEVKLKGNAQNGIPFFKVGYHEFIDEPLVLPEKVLELSGGSSGLTSGGRIGAESTTAFSIEAGSGKIFDYSNMADPSYFDVSWDAIPSTEITNITTEAITHLAIDRTGTIRQFRPEEEAFLSRDFIYLGYIWHPSSVIDQIINDSLTPHEPYVQLLDLLDTLGVVRGVGLNITLNDDMTFSKSSGNVLMAGAGNINQERKSNLMSIAAASPQTFSRLLGRTVTTESANTDQVKADIWDDGTQTGATLPGTAAQILYFYQFPLSEGVVMVYGQNAYTGGISEALASAVADASNIQLPQGFTDKALLLFRLVVTGNATVLSDSNQAVYLIGPKFGTTLSGGAGGTGAGGDYFGPADSQIDEIHTFNDDTGKIGKSGSDVSVLNGDFKRLLGDRFYFERKSGGQIILGSLNSKRVALNANADFVAASGAKIGVGDISPEGWLQSGTKALDTHSYTKDRNAPLVSNQLTHNGGTSPAPSEPALILMRSGVSAQAYGNIVEYAVSRYEHVSTNARTRLDIKMAHATGNAEGNNPPIHHSLYSSGELDTRAGAKWVIGGPRSSQDHILELIGAGAFMPPEVTTAQRNAFNVKNGAIVQNTTTGQLEQRKNNAWSAIVGITGPNTSINNEIVVFNGVNGQVIKSGAGVKAEQGVITHADAGGNLLITHNQGGRIRIGFGMSIESSGPAIFTISSTTQGSIPAPPMTKAQRDNILNPVAGLQVYVTDDMGGYISDYNGQEWSSKAAGGASVYTISQQYLDVVPEASNFLTAYRKTPLTYYGPDALVENIRVYAGKAPAGGVTSIFTVTAGSVPIGLGTLPRGDNQTEDLSVPAGVTIGNGQVIEFSWTPIFGGAGAENLEVFITIRPQ